MKPPPDQPTERLRSGPDWISLGLRLLVGGIFVCAGGLKLTNPAQFAIAVGNYRLVPPELANLVAVLLPAIELVAGFFVLTGLWLRAASLVIAGLTAVFLLAIASALVRGLNIECGCFGTAGGRHIGLTSLALDGTLLMLALWLVRQSRGHSANPIPRPARIG